jgi:hypothetical protein
LAQMFDDLTPSRRVRRRVVNGATTEIKRISREHRI